MQDFSTDTPKKCGCGGHGSASEKKKESHSGCGCHAASATQLSLQQLLPLTQEAHSCGGECHGIRAYKRLHAALGVLLMGFLLMHLGVASLGWVPVWYEASASLLRKISADVPLLEIGLLLVIVVQILVGLRLLLRAGLGITASRCKEDDRLRYFFQRWSGLILLIFLVVHLALFSLWKGASSLAAASERFTLGGTPWMLKGNPLSAFWIGFTLLTIAGLSFHAGNGLWTGASVWGVRDRYPRLCLGLAAAAGGVIALLGCGAFLAFVR